MAWFPTDEVIGEFGICLFLNYCDSTGLDLECKGGALGKKGQALLNDQRASKLIHLYSIS